MPIWMSEGEIGSRNRGGGDTGSLMNRLGIAALALMAATGSGLAASAVNLDKEPRTIVVTEGGTRTEITIGAGESVQFCPSGCFVTLPNGDRAPLAGSETVEISNGAGRVR